MVVNKHISELAVGDYVVSIVKQKSNHAIKSAGWLRDPRTITYLKNQGVLIVQVDPEKKLTSQTIPETTDDDNQAAIPEVNEEPTSNQVEQVIPKKMLTSSGEFAQRLVKAKKLFDEAKQIQTKLLEDIRQGRPVDPTPVISLSNASIDCIFENPDALACVINIRSKDAYLLEHSISVSILISIFATFLNYSRDIIHQLAVGAFLHDVGKIKIPDAILHKPGRLTYEEFEVMKKHAVYSAQIAKETPGLSDLSRQIIANHHEKLNGHGYPKGLQDSQLTTFDRMITICDIFDALSAHRVYKPGIAQIKAFVILRELAQQGDLDLKLVDGFIKCLGVYPVGSLVKLTSNRLAIVDGRNPDSPTKPKVKAFFDLENNSFMKTTEIDLAQVTGEDIVQGVRADDFNLDMAKISDFLEMQG